MVEIKAEWGGDRGLMQKANYRVLCAAMGDVSAYMPALVKGEEKPKAKGYADTYGTDKHKSNWKEEDYLMPKEEKR
ncbi:unnamed protein product [Toxocara canis]|uniref:Oxidored_molyb domain-containing protein n=1 Tax=Toxocara canis TaxID=6265 RepID=A0A183UKM1_TOXCA|nr:unnamed protein product [Toxocara canis]